MNLFLIVGVIIAYLMGSWVGIFWYCFGAVVLSVTQKR
jgi:Na+/H+ antiporter NhaA